MRPSRTRAMWDPEKGTRMGGQGDVGHTSSASSPLSQWGMEPDVRTCWLSPHTCPLWLVVSCPISWDTANDTKPYSNEQKRELTTLCDWKSSDILSQLQLCLDAGPKWCHQLLFYTLSSTLLFFILASLWSNSMVAMWQLAAPQTQQE